MNRHELANELITAGDGERAELLTRSGHLLDLDLAYYLKDLFDAADAANPARSTAVSATLTVLADHLDHPEARALACWVAGMEAQTHGRMEEALGLIERAEQLFLTGGKTLAAAETQTSKLVALAILGRYDEAIEVGTRARETFIAHQRWTDTGKIEQNLGNIYARRERHHDSEHLFRMARARYEKARDWRQLAQVENNLATALKWQHRFDEAAGHYQQALELTRAEGMAVAEAAIESNLGVLALFQGQYNTALDYLERSRRRYAVLDIPHESAIAEQELAEAYLELNLAPEAAAIYERITPVFARLGMRAEQARALLLHGRAALSLGNTGTAGALLAEARRLYVEEENPAALAAVSLTEAQLLYSEGEYTGAARLACDAADVLLETGSYGQTLVAQWLNGEATRCAGNLTTARAILETTAADAAAQHVPQVAQRSHTSLGLVAVSLGSREQAEAEFQRAIELIESLGSPLPTEEFRTAYIADKLTPYAEMVRLHLERPEGNAAALQFVEKARSRVLLDAIGGAFSVGPTPKDSFEADTIRRMDELREELSWFYSQMHRPAIDQDEPDANGVEESRRAIREREQELLEIQRQLLQAGGGEYIRSGDLNIGQLQRALSDDTTLLEYFSLDGELMAFVVSGSKVNIVRGIGNEQQVGSLTSEFRFQVDTLRYGASHLSRHLDQLTERANHYLRKLYDFLLAPLEQWIATERIVVVPHRGLHYVPFHALFDGASHVIERYEVSYAPGANVLLHCLEQAPRRLESALIVGVTDELIPGARDELDTIAPYFSSSSVLLDGQATLDALQSQTAGADILHLACHGHFRPDNPRFSALRLADGWFTVHDAYSLDLRCDLVTLSACETGMSDIAPGDEMIGLTRGFFAAGAPTVLVSMWRVDDDTTSALMGGFYRRLQTGDRPAAALRGAQREIRQEQHHPFFWSPFIVHGRW